MKKLLYSLFAILAMAACSGGGGTNNGGGNNNQGGGNAPTAPTITLSKSSVSFGESAAEEKISVSASVDWTAEIVNDRADNWLGVSPQSGAAGDNSITITATDNNTPDERTAAIRIKAGSAQKTINVSQKQKDALTVTSSKFEVAAEGGEVVIEVKANIDFDYAIDESAKEWISYEGTRAIKTSTLVFKVSPNDSDEKREGKITIKSGEFNEVVTIYQASKEPTIVISQNEYVVSSNGETISIDVSSNVDVSVEISSDVDWITENTTRATSTNTYHFDISPNEDYEQRSAEIMFTNKENNLSEVVKVTQTQKNALVVAKDSYTVDSEGDQIEIEVGHNIDFDVEISADWITKADTRAFVTDKLTFVIAENTGAENREGAILFKSKNGTLTQTVKVYQSQKDALIVSKNDIVVSAESGTLSFEILSNVEFTVSAPNVDWLRATTTRGLTTHTLHYEYDANSSYDSRVAYIVVTNTKNNKSETITITQAQRDALVLAKDSYTVDSEGDQIEIEIGHNIDFDVEISADWITKADTRAFVTDKLTFVIAENTDAENREGKIYFKSKNGALTQTVKVYQAQKDALIISDKNIVVSDEGGNISFEIQSNIEFTVSDPDVDWLHAVTTRSLTTHTLNYQVDANTSYDSREAKIIVTNTKNNTTETITITQAQKNAIILGSKNIEVNKAGGNIQFEIKANISFSISDPEVDWLRKVSTRSLTSYILNYEVDANPSYNSRSTRLVVTNTENNISETIIITQQGGDIVFTLDKSEINFDVQGGSIDVQITSNADWSITNIPSWLSVSRSSGSGSGSITLVTSANTLAQSRSAILTFTAMNTTISLRVNQDAATAVIQLGVKSIEASRYSGSSQVYLTTNGAEWVATGIPDWLNVSPSSGTGSTYVTFSWSENSIAVGRNSTITFTAGEQSSSVDVTQVAAPGIISIDATQKNIDAATTEFNVNITTNNSEWYITENLSWVSVSQTEGINNSTISILCDENLTSSSRYGYIYFYTKDGSQSRSLYISQAGQYILTLDTTSVTFRGDKATQTIPFTSNSYWYASTTESWISLSRTSGSTSYTSTDVTAAANNTGVTRSGKVIFRLGDSYTKEVIITQYYIPTLTSSATELRAPARSSSHSVSIEANTAWNITTDATWCTVAPSTSSGNGEVVISVTENPNYEERTATITITAGEAGPGYTNSTITITQNGRNAFDTNDWIENEDQGGVAE